MASFLRQKREAGSNDEDERTAPQVLAQLSPRTLCEVANEVEFASWHIDGRLAWVHALGQTGLPEAVPALALLLQDPAYRIRRNAARYMANYSDALNFPILSDLLVRDTKGAMNVAEGLLWFDGDWAQTLQVALARHEDQRVRHRIVSIRKWRRFRQTDQILLERYRSAISPRECWLYGKALQSTEDENVITQLTQDAQWEGRQQHAKRFLVARCCLKAASQSVQEHIERMEKDWSVR